MYTTVQLLNNLRRLTFFSNTANVIITLPVNSSAPVSATIIKPVANVIAPINLVKPQPILESPVITVNDTCAPKAIKAPAAIASVNIFVLL